MSSHAGLPLLSGPPPPHSSSDSGACRKCSREFSLLFNRQRKCMHCGHAYCSSCTDYQALMPRHGPARGYDLAPVCGYCIEMLNITAHSRSQLRSLPLAKLRRYIDAYNIPIKNPIDKNDFIDAIVNVRSSQGCLPFANEDYYRKHSVPTATSGSSQSHSSTRNTSSRTRSTNTQPSNTSNASRPQRQFPRPDLDPSRQQQSQEVPYRTYTSRTTSNTQRTRTTSAPSNTGTARQTGWQSNANFTTSSGTRQTSSRTTGNFDSNTPSSSVPPRPAAASPVPPAPMSTLVTLTRSEISALPVGTLKQILFEARVRVPPGVVEKEELVVRVWAIVEEERRKNEAATDDADFDEEVDDMEGVEEHDHDEEIVNDMVDPDWDTHYDGSHGHHYESRQDQHHSATYGGDRRDVEMHEEQTSAPGAETGHSFVRSTTPPHLQTSPAPKTKTRSPKHASAERSGLCVICQDEEANIAIVDCGHLAMCRACSELVLASSRECPLCRTRIVTEARLLRIFKT